MADQAGLGQPKLEAVLCNKGYTDAYAMLFGSCDRAESYFLITVRRCQAISFGTEADLIYYIQADVTPVQLHGMSERQVVEFIVLERELLWNICCLSYNA